MIIMSTKKKIKSYIKSDRPLKLKSYISSHGVNIDKVKFSHGRNVLHYCSENGSPEMLKVLLQLCHKTSSQDRDGNLPLHMALHRGLQEDVSSARETFTDMVMPLIEAYSLGQDVENNQGETGHDLMQRLKKKIRSHNTKHKQTAAGRSEHDESEDEKWRQKLYEEASFEYEEQLPRHVPDEDYLQPSTQEAFDHFAERIRQEHIAKSKRDNQHIFWRDRKRRQQDSEESRHGGKKSRLESKEEEKLKAAREKMKNSFKPDAAVDKLNRFKSQKQNYERKFGHLLSHLAGKTLTFGCIPWPCLDLATLDQVLFSDLPDNQSPDYRRYLRAQQIRWHPDRFTQKFRDHLHPDHVTKIMAKVKAISQFLNRLSTDMQDKK